MEEQNVGKKTGAPKKGLVIAGVAAALAAAAYLGLCAWVYQQDTIFPNVSVAGLNVSGMSANQAQQVILQSFDPSAQSNLGSSVQLRSEGYTGYLNADCFELDAQSCAQSALLAGRENFFAAGGLYAAHLLGASKTLPVAPIVLNVQGRQELERQMQSADAALGVERAGDEYIVDLDQKTLTIVKGRTHRAVDREAAETMVRDVFSQALQGQAGVVQLETVQQLPQDPGFEAIHARLYAQVQDAYMDPETYEITEGVAGVDFDVAGATAAFHAAAEGATVTIPLQVTQPAETKQSLEAKLFRDLLGQATSTVSGTANRKSNVKLSAQACNGIVLLPGEEFSYNNTTGSRSAAKGYLSAPIYIGGKSEDDIGGGICQTSSTIYYAVLHTTLEVVERHDHQFAVGYVPDGMDATVFFGSLDFRFKNNTQYPVKLVTESYDKGGRRYLTVKLYGTNVDGRYAVPERIQFDWVSPTVAYQADSAVPRGTLVLDEKQNAYSGRKAHTYRYIYEQDGTLVEKQDMGASKYAMRPHLYHYNPLDGDPAAWVGGKPPAASAEPDIETGGSSPGGEAEAPQGGDTPATDKEDTSEGAAVSPDEGWVDPLLGLKELLQQVDAQG